MTLSLKTLNIALIAIGCGALAGSALASSVQGSFYDPRNRASGNQAGNTTGFELYRTIGCPGRGLLDPGCVEDKKPAAKPVAKPAPCPLPPGALVGDKTPLNAKAGECYAKVVRPAQYRTDTVRKLVREASERIETIPAKYETVKERVLVKEAGERIEIVPPVYKAVKVRVQSEEIQEVVPAVYETV